MKLRGVERRVGHGESGIGMHECIGFELHGTGETNKCLFQPSEPPPRQSNCSPPNPRGRSRPQNWKPAWATVLFRTVSARCRKLVHRTSNPRTWIGIDPFGTRIRFNRGPVFGGVGKPPVFQLWTVHIFGGGQTSRVVVNTAGYRITPDRGAKVTQKIDLPFAQPDLQAPAVGRALSPGGGFGQRNSRQTADQLVNSGLSRLWPESLLGLSLFDTCGGGCGGSLWLPQVPTNPSDGDGIDDAFKDWMDSIWCVGT